MQQNLMRLFVVCFLFVAPDVVAARPNIVYVLADDMGYGDLGCFGSKLQETPSIDALAANGVRMIDFHASSWCAPSRRALMTGCQPNRPWGPQSKRLASAITIAELLKRANYETALLGKWHLGMNPGLHPLDQGFDYWYGTRGSNDWDGPKPNYDSFRNAPEKAWKTPLYINRENQGPIVPQSLFTKRYTEEAVRLIRKKRDSPFFIYLAHNMPHVPVFASKEFQRHSKNGVYGDVIEEIDWSVGKIVEALRETGQLNNTIVVFTSDNGPWKMFGKFGGHAGALRGEKSTTWEGGERVPCIVSWPIRIKPAVRSDLMANYDMYATLASLANLEVPDGQAIDSIDFSSTFLRGKPGSRKKHVYYHHGPMAYRSGKWKLHLKTRERTRDPETGKQEPSISHDPPLLFDLNNDIAESRNVASQHPDLVERLTKEFKEAQQAIKDWKPF